MKMCFFLKKKKNWIKVYFLILFMYGENIVKIELFNQELIQNFFIFLFIFRKFTWKHVYIFLTYVDF